MKRVLIAALGFAALSATVPAFAEWTYVIKDFEEGSNLYIDLNTLRKDSNTRRVWTLRNLPKVGPSGQLSELHRLEFDCDLERFRMISSTSRSGPLGVGNTISISDKPTPWGNLSPNSVGEAFMRIVCN